MLFATLSQLHARSSAPARRFLLPIHSAVATKPELRESERFGGVVKIIGGPIFRESAGFWAKTAPENGSVRKDIRWLRIPRIPLDRNRKFSKYQKMQFSGAGRNPFKEILSGGGWENFPPKIFPTQKMTKKFSDHWAHLEELFFQNFGPSARHGGKIWPVSGT